MRKKQLGTTDLRITGLGLGTWAIGGENWQYSWGKQDDQDSIAAIRFAIEQGINWIDTAPAYGLGRSETVIAEALSVYNEREKPYVFTKWGITWDNNRALLFSGDPETIRQEVAGSLKRLKTDQITLYQLHWPSRTGISIERSWEALLRLKEEGLILYAGVSNLSLAQLQACHAVGSIDSLQPPFSLLNRHIAAEVLPWCHQHNVGVLAYSPLQSGLLTGKYTPERIGQLSPDDWRLQSPNFQEPDLSRNLALMRHLTRQASVKRTTVTAIALAWVQAWPGVTGAIVGARNPQQVADWLSSEFVQLSPDELWQLNAALQETEAGGGPLFPF